MEKQQGNARQETPKSLFRSFGVFASRVHVYPLLAKSWSCFPRYLLLESLADQSPYLRAFWMALPMAVRTVAYMV